MTTKRKPTKATAKPTKQAVAKAVAKVKAPKPKSAMRLFRRRRSRGRNRVKSNGAGPPFKYPWDIWLKPGAVHFLERGTDYDCTTRSMIVQLYQTSKSRGVSISVQETPDNRIRIEVV